MRQNLVDPIKLAIYDPQHAFRLGLEQALHNENDIDLQWSVSSFHDAMTLCTEFPPDVLLLNFTNPSQAMKEGLSSFRTRCADTEIVALVDHRVDVCRILLERSSGTGCLGHAACCITAAFAYGAKSAIRKSASPGEILELIRAAGGFGDGSVRSSSGSEDYFRDIDRLSEQPTALGVA